MAASSSPASARKPRPSLSFWLLVIAVLLGAWALRLHRLDFQDIWWDEARNIDVATRPFLHIATAPELDIHPPVYFYALHGWTKAASSRAFATRFFSLWFGVLAAVLTYRLGRALARENQARTVGLLALLLAAFAPYALAEAQETRMYTFSWALPAASMLALWRALRAPGGSPSQQMRQWGPFVALAALALLTHYATAMIFVPWGAWLLVWALVSKERRSRLLTLLGVGLATAALFLPILPIALRQIPGYDNPNLLLPDWRQYLAQLHHAFTLGEFAPDQVWEWMRWVWLILVGGGALLALTDIWQKREAAIPTAAPVPWRLRHLSLLATWLFGGLLVFYLVLVARSAFNPRYISFILPPLWALAGWALAGWARLWRPLPWLAALTLIAAAIPSLHADLYDPAHFREDASAVAAYLHAHATPADIILVDQRYPFGFYWQRWNNDFYGHPPAQPADQAPAQYLFVDLTHDDERRIDHRLTALAGRARRVYWLTWFESDMDPRGAVSALLNAYGTPVEEKQFRGYAVQVWELDPPVTFELAGAFLPLEIRFEPGITLVEGDWSGREEASAGARTALVALRWQADGPTTRPLKVSLRLKDVDGATLAQDDRLLLSDRHLRTTAWTPGESALNVYSLPLPSHPGEYSLTVVVYDEETLEPVGVSDGSGIEPTIGALRVGE